MSKPIPKCLHHEFVGYVAVVDNDDLPDGAWFAVIEDACQHFMDDHGMNGWADRNDAAHQYLCLAYPEETT